MNRIGVVGLVVIVAVSSFWFIYRSIIGSIAIPKSELEPTPNGVPNISQTATPMIINTPTNKLIPTSTVTKNPTQLPVTPKSTQPPTNPSQSLSDWYYPGSQILSVTDKTVNLVTSDEPDKVTDWYKAKLNDAGMTAKTVVKTQTNGTVENVVAGAGGGINIKITITHQPKELDTKIKVEIS